MVPRMSPACSIASSVRSTRRKRDLGVLTGACTWRLRRLIVTTSHGARPPPGSGGARPLKLTTPRSLSCRSRGWPDAGPGAPAPEPACSCARDRTGRSAPGPLAVPFASLRAIDTPARLARPGPAGAGARWPPAVPADWTTPPPTCRRSCCKSRLLAKPRVTSSASTRRGGGWPKPPRGRRPISPERAGPERASRGGVSMAPTEGLSEGGEQRGAPPRDALLGRTRRRVRGRRSMCRPSDTAAARGAKQNRPHAVKKDTYANCGTGTGDEDSAFSEQPEELLLGAR